MPEYPMELDSRAWKLLTAMQRNARLPLKTLAEETGLSIPATAERLRKLEEAGVITGYHAHVEPEAVGLGVSALIGITTAQPGKARLIEHLRNCPEVLECLHVTGQDSYVLRVAVCSIRHLEQFVSQINPFGETRTSIIMSTPIPLRGVCPAPEGANSPASPPDGR